MSELIKKYYEEIDLPPVVIQQNLEKFDRNPDIAKEFEFWIDNEKYIGQDCVIIEGHTAEELSRLSRLLVGESSFLLLIELREEPEKAKRKISKGFKVK